MGEGEDGARDLDELRWHWGSAYLIDRFGPGRWVAQRRDSRATISADNPESLHDRIAADYQQRPVPRAYDPRFSPE